jgi:hypothetical protein
MMALSILATYNVQRKPPSGVYKRVNHEMSCIWLSCWSLPRAAASGFARHPELPLLRLALLPGFMFMRIAHSA